MRKQIYRSLILFLLLIGGISSWGQGTMMPMPAQSTTYSGYVRGYWFTAPTAFTITGLRVPTSAGTGLQAIQVMKVLDNPPVLYSTQSTNFNTLFFTDSGANGAIIPVNIQVQAGEIIGILGQVGDGGGTTSYSAAMNPSFATTINGQSVNLTRFISQISIVSAPAPNYSTEASGSLGIVEMYYVTDTCTGQPTAGTVVDSMMTCTGLPLSISPSGTTSAMGIHTQWQQRAPGTSSWTDMTGQTGLSLNIPGGISTATEYRYWISCDSSGLSDTSSVVYVGITPASQCYCTPTYTYDCSDGDEISNVSLVGTSISLNNSTQCSLAGYGDYTSLPAPDLVPALSYNISIATDYVAPSAENARAWIDWNNNGLFESNEIIADASATAGTGLAAGGSTFNFTVPPTATPGDHRMRVRLAYSTSDIDPCANYSYGETEDYTINVIALTPCTGTPSAGAIDTAATLGVCANNPFSLTDTGFTIAGNMTYQWQQRVPAGTGTWQDIAGANGMTLNLSNGITANTDYRFYVSCVNSNSSDTTAPVSVVLGATPAPFLEEFSNGTLPGCWGSTSDGTGTTAFWLFTGTPGYGAATNGKPAGTFAWVDASAPYTGIHAVTLTTPSINVATLNVPYLSFTWFKNNQEPTLYDNNKLKVDVNDGTGWVNVFSDTSNADHWRVVHIPLTGLTDSIIQVRFVVDKDLGNGYFYDDLLLDSVSVTEAPLACTGVPTLASISLPSSVCSGVPLPLQATALNNIGVTYQWQSTPTGANAWTNINGATSANYTLSAGISVPTDFRLIAVCTTSTFSDTSNVQSISITPANQCYCIPTSTSATYGITNFSTTGAMVDINHSSAGGQGYVNNSATDTAAQIPGGTVNFSVTVVPSESVGIWVDWNNNGNFTDPGEQVFNANTFVSNITGSFTVPLTTTLGVHRMRVVSNAVVSTPAPCDDLGYAGYGEAEDYSLNIMPLASCDTVTLPSNIAATIDQDTVCANGGGNISLGLDTSLAAVGGLTYQWQKSSNGTSGWTNMGTAQMVPPITDPNVSANTWYRCQILCDGTLDVTTSTISVFVSNPSLGTVPSDQDICGTGSVTLNATATTGSSVHWYDADAGGNLLGTGNSYTDTFSQTDTVWVAAGTGGGGMPQSLLTTTAAGNGADGNLFDIDVTNTIRIDSFSIAATTPGTQVGIYYRVGTGTGFNTSNTGWTLLGTATINNVGSPLSVIPLFVNLTLSPGTYSFALATSTTVNYTDGTTLGNVFVSDANVAIKEGYGGSTAYPGFGFTNQPRVWNGTLYYSLSGCETPRQPVVITVHDSVSVNLGNDTTICEGTPFTLDAGTPGSNYTWNTGATTETISVSDSGTYSVHVVAPWGCEGDGSINVNVTPLPHVDDITAVHNGDDSYTFTANNVVGGVNYSWDFGDGQGFSSSAHPTYLYGAYGDYTVTLILSNDCGADTTQLIVHYTSGDEGISNVDPGKNLLKLYPNPARDIVTLSNESSQKMQTVEVYNVLGQRIFKANTNNGSTYQLHVDGYASGMYSVKIFFEDGTWAQRKFEIAK